MNPQDKQQFTNPPLQNQNKQNIHSRPQPNINMQQPQNMYNQNQQPYKQGIYQGGQSRIPPQGQQQQSQNQQQMRQSQNPNIQSSQQQQQMNRHLQQKLMLQQQQQQQQQQMHKESILDSKAQLQEIYEKNNPFEFDQELHNIAPEIKILEKLQHYENTLDKMIKRKRFDMQEQFAKPIPTQKHVLRIKLTSKMCDNQGQTDGPLTHWQIKLEGKLLTNNIELNGKFRARKFTSFFSKINFGVDPDIYPQYQNIQFQRKEPIAESDCILIQREGNQEFETCIDLEVLNNPPKFKVKKELANIIGMNNCSRTEILTAIWEYIKMQNLQDRENKNLINNDEALKNIFGVDKMTMGSITSRIKDLIDLEDPVQIQHTVTSIPQERIFDMQVDVPYPFGLEIMPFLSQKVVMDEKKDSQMIHPFMELNQNIKKLEKKQLESLERLKSHKYKRDSYYAYSLQPSLFIENILLQQNQLLKIMNQTSKPALNEPNQLSYFVENEEDVLKQLTELIDEHQNSKHRQKLQQQQQQHQQQNQSQQHGHIQQQHPIPNISQNNQPQQN